jgi:GMP synthase-like glutamine amidotransferase
VFAHARGGRATSNPLGPTLFQVESSPSSTQQGKEWFGEESSYQLLSSHCDIVQTPGRDGVTLLSSSRCEHQVVGYFDKEKNPYAFTIQSHPEYCCGGRAILDSVAEVMGVFEGSQEVDEERCAASSTTIMKTMIIGLWG